MRSLLLCLGCAVALAAEDDGIARGEGGDQEAVGDAPLVHLRLHDPSRSLARLRGGPYGDAWLVPEAAPLRELAAMWLRAGTAAWDLPEVGVLVAGSDYADAALYRVPDARRPGFRVQLRGGEVVRACYEAVAERLGPEAELAIDDDLAGADEGLIGPGGNATLVRWGDALVLSSLDRSARPTLPDAIGADDLALTWSAAAIRAAVLADAPDPGARLLAGLLVDGSVAARFVDDGLALRAEMVSPAALFAGPVDRDLLATVPARVAHLAAARIDPAAWWRVREQTLQAFAAETGNPDLEPAALAANLDAVLENAGVGVDFAGLLASLDGTLCVALEPGTGPLPHLHVLLPRGEEADRLIGWVLEASGNPLPTEGATAFVSLPLHEGRMRRLTAGTCVRRGTRHWHFASNSVALARWDEGPRWLDGPGAGFVDGLDELRALAWADGRGLHDLLVPAAGIAAGATGEEALVRAVLPMVHALARAGGPEVLVLRGDAEGVVIDGRGLFGGLGALAPPHLLLFGVAFAGRAGPARAAPPSPDTTPPPAPPPGP